MNHIAIFTLLLTLMLPVAANNILYNSSGEKLNSATKLPSGWRMLSEGISEQCHFVENQARDGAVAFKLFCDQKITEANLVCFYQRGLGGDMKAFAPGKLMEFSFFGTTHSNPSTRFKYFVEFKKEEKPVKRFDSGEKDVYFGWSEQVLQFEMPDVDYDEVTVYVQLLTAGTLIFDRLYLGGAINEFERSNTPLPDDYCRVADFPMQNTFCGRMPAQTFKLDKHLSEDNLLVELFTEAGTKLDCTFNKIAGTITLPALDIGNYELKFTAGEFKTTELFRVLEKKRQRISFDRNNIMEVNNEKVFPIIFVSPVLSHDAFRIYHEIGITAIAVRSLTDNLEYAQFIGRETGKYELNLFCWSNPGGDFAGKSEAAGLKAVCDRIVVARKLDRFLGWFDDESEHRKVPLTSVQKAYQTFYFNAPEYLFWANHAPRLTNTTKNHESFNSVRRYSLACDVVGIDIYPVPEGNYHSNLANKTLSCVGEYTDLLHRNAFGKPIWMTLQTFSWSVYGGSADNPRPNYHQLRFMVYNAITHGATGISLYGVIQDIYSEYMAMVGDVTKELRAISPQLINGKKSLLSSDETVRAVQYDYNGDMLIIVVNESKEKTSFAIPEGNFFHTVSGEAVNPGCLVLDGQSVAIVSNRKIIIPKTKPFVKTVVNSDPFAVKTWTAQWVNHPDLGTTDGALTFVRHKFDLPDRPEKFIFNITGDDKWQLRVNGKKIGSGFSHKAVLRYDLADVVHKGNNLIEVELLNLTGPSGILFDGEAVFPNQTVRIASGKDTQFSDSTLTHWQNGRLLGKPPMKPWGELTTFIDGKREEE